MIYFIVTTNSSAMPLYAFLAPSKWPGYYQLIQVRYV